MREDRLTPKVALITGGNSGIGLATARLFKDQGASIVIVGQNKTTLDLTCKELGGDTLALQADVAKVADVERVMSQVREAFGKIDILFANAGISDCPPIQETEEAFFDHIIGINVKGVFFTFVKALPLLVKGASVIFTSSVAHKRGRPGDPLYSASKAAVRSLARTLAADETVLEKKIRVNVVSPGAIQTPLTEQESPEMRESIKAYIENSVPMKRWGLPEEVAKAVLFLASSDASYLTGGEIAVDGGLGQI
ncbi:MAG: SDR family oxidoreductase [Negativicutes bacterium]|nr:SDR family oxidoreductase [Negativicutes bacterium]